MIQKRSILVGFLVVVLASTTWGMSDYTMLSVRSLNNDSMPSISIVGGGLISSTPFFGMNAINVDIISNNNVAFTEIGLGWGWHRRNWLVMTGPALVGGFPGLFGVARFSGDFPGLFGVGSSPGGRLNFHIKGSVGLIPCERYKPVWTFEIRTAMEIVLCCNLSFWGFIHQKIVSFYGARVEFVDGALGYSPFRPLYVIGGADFWTGDLKPYVGFGLRYTSAEITAKVYLDKCFGNCFSPLFMGFGIGLNLRL